MGYPDELCRLVMENMEIIEEMPSVVDEVATRLFEVINKRIEQRVAALENWKGCYELCAGDADETTFAPSAWPENDAGGYLAYYQLNESQPDIVTYWLSVALGIRGCSLSLRFGLEREFTELKPKEYKKSFLDFYNATPLLAKSGFLYDEKKPEIYLPFVLVATKLVEEYPDIDEALAPLDAALEKLFEAHNAFDGFVNSYRKPDC